MASERREHALGPLRIHFPDATFSTFWFAHDLVDLVDAEDNADAQRRLATALAGDQRGVDLDHEADAVVAHARGWKAMATVLRALTGIASRPPWTDAELDELCHAMRAWRRPPAVRYDTGDVVAVPLCAGHVGAAQVAGFQEAGESRGHPLLLLFGRAPRTRAELSSLLGPEAEQPVGGKVIVDSEILTGEWPVIGRRSVGDVDVAALLARERGTSATGGVAVNFIEAYAGLRAWDAGYDPRAYEQMLLPGVEPPSDRRYLRDLLAARLIAAFGQVPEGPTTGSAIVHVHLVYPGHGAPRLVDLSRIRQLSLRVRQHVPGAEVLLTGGGDGFLDLITSTSDVVAASRAIDDAIAALGLSKDTLIDLYLPVALDRIALCTPQDKGDVDGRET